MKSFYGSLRGDDLERPRLHEMRGEGGYTCEHKKI
jgi:hypothetical protein